MEKKKYCIDCDDYPECMLTGVCADDDSCEEFSETDPEEPGNK